MRIMKDAIVEYVPTLRERNIRLRILGDLSRFEPDARAGLEDSVAALAGNTGMTLSVALSYGGRDEIVAAARKAAAAGEITKETLSAHLYTAGMPDPDLIIRTSGESVCQFPSAERVQRILFTPTVARFRAQYMPRPVGLQRPQAPPVKPPCGDLIVMTKRIATAVVALALFVPSCIRQLRYISVVALLGGRVWEMLGCMACARLFLAALGAVTSPRRHWRGSVRTRYPLYLVYGLYLLFASVLFYSKTEFVTLAKTAFTMLFVTFGFASLVLVRDAEPLRYLLIFVAAWSTDTFALFAGKLFGRRKLCEHISPKKTVAGAVGGVIGCIAAFAVYALAVGLLYDIWETWENYLLLALLAVCGSLVSMLGDLAASVIKRAFGVKDYGNIFPGHGGVLDRFDSILPLGTRCGAAGGERQTGGSSSWRPARSAVRRWTCCARRERPRILTANRRGGADALCREFLPDECVIGDDG
ncbi:MAG: phosphatidate cytidylyltransferase [Acutalibacteraceae bacterium]